MYKECRLTETLPVQHLLVMATAVSMKNTRFVHPLRHDSQKENLERKTMIKVKSHYALRAIQISKSNNSPTFHNASIIATLNDFEGTDFYVVHYSLTSGSIMR